MKKYVIRTHRNGRIRISEPKTLEELVEGAKYTLETGKSYQHEKGKSKINTNPKTINSFITNFNNAKDNAARDGFANHWIELAETIIE